MSRVALYSLFLTLVTADDFRVHHLHGRGSHHVKLHRHNQAATSFAVDASGEYFRTSPKKDEVKKLMKSKSLYAVNKSASTNKVRRNRHQFRFKGQMLRNKLQQEETNTKKRTLKDATTKAKEAEQMKAQETNTKKRTLKDATTKAKEAEQMKAQGKTAEQMVAEKRARLRKEFQEQEKARISAEKVAQLEKKRRDADKEKQDDKLEISKEVAEEEEKQDDELEISKEVDEEEEHGNQARKADSALFSRDGGKKLVRTKRKDLVRHERILRENSISQETKPEAQSATQGYVGVDDE